MSAWERVQKKLIAELESLACSDPMFRGHADESWSLLPSLARRKDHAKDVENRLYYRFTSKGHHFLGRPDNTWHSLYLMQHHGVPTRLLDWTGSFAVALYFALKDLTTDGVVWILDPFELNKELLKVEGLCHLPIDFPAGYEKYFVDSYGEHEFFGAFPAAAVALAGDTFTPRIHAQHGAFTLHKDLDRPLEEICPTVLRKVTIPAAAYSDSRQFLRLVGINEYSLFPDLDGLARHLLAELTGE